MAGVEGANPAAGILVVEPSKFGLSGTVLTRAGAADDLARCLADGLAKFHRAAATFGPHVRDGKRQGVLWETPLPVTDPLERAARERTGGPRPE